MTDARRLALSVTSFRLHEKREYIIYVYEVLLHICDDQYRGRIGGRRWFTHCFRSCSLFIIEGRRIVLFLGGDDADMDMSDCEDIEPAMLWLVPVVLRAGVG
jgi:hypothetical protein